MKRSPYLFLCCLFCTAAFSQQIVPEFGKIDPADLKLKACPFEPGAGAMKLFDVTESEVTYDEYNSTVKTERRVRIKIFTEAGYEHATVKIPFYRKNSAYKVEDVKAIVYNLDGSGKVVAQRLEKKDFLKNKSDKYVGFINFTFPQLRPGSVVEYSYTRTVYDNIHLDTWVVQDAIPIQYAVNAIVVPGDARMKEKFFGPDTVMQRRQLLSESREKYTYYKENISSFLGEPYMTSARDNLLRVSYFMLPHTTSVVNVFSLPNVIWSIAGRQFLNSRFVMGQIATDIPGTDSLLKAAKNIPSVYNRVQFLFRAVKAQNTDRPEQDFLPLDISEAWKNRSGSTAELNLILINLLRRAGVPCFPLLVSTRSHGNIRTDFPSFSQFNGMDVVAMDSGKVYILDAGFKSQTVDVPPPNVLNRLGLLLNGETLTWMRITDPRPLFKQDLRAQASLSSEGNLVGKATKTSYSYAKMALLDSGEKEAAEYRSGNADGLKVQQYKIEDSGLDSDPVTERLDFEWPLQQTGDFSFVRPQFLLPLGKNPFTNEARTTDVDFGCNQDLRFALTVDVPPAHTVESLPKDVVLQSPDSAFYFKRTCTQNATSVTLTQSFEIKKSQFDKGSYPAIRDFFQKLYALADEEIIFKKKR